MDVEECVKIIEAFEPTEDRTTMSMEGKQIFYSSFILQDLQYL